MCMRICISLMPAMFTGRVVLHHVCTFCWQELLCLVHVHGHQNVQVVTTTLCTYTSTDLPFWCSCSWLEFW